MLKNKVHSASSKAVIRDLVNQYRAFRMNLRDLLLVHGVPSDPGWADEDIIEALAELLNKKNSKTRKRKIRKRKN